MRNRLVGVSAAACVLAGLGACGSNSKVASAPVHQKRAANPDAVPAVLAGVWHGRFGSVDQKIAFSANGYRVWVQPDDVARGLVKARGHQVTLYGSTTCMGSGIYEWSVVSGALTFRPVGKDPCPRSQLLPGKKWTRQ